MVFNKANATGWEPKEKLTAQQLNTIDNNQSQAIDGSAGGDYSPTANITIDDANGGGVGNLDINGDLILKNTSQARLESGGSCTVDSGANLYLDGYQLVRAGSLHFGGTNPQIDTRRVRRWITPSSHVVGCTFTGSPPKPEYCYGGIVAFDDEARDGTVFGRAEWRAVGASITIDITPFLIQGCTIYGIELGINPSGVAAAPSGLPSFDLLRRQVGSTLDNVATGNDIGGAGYRDAHEILAYNIGEVVNLEESSYFIRFSAESGTNSSIGGTLDYLEVIMDVDEIRY